MAEEKSDALFVHELRADNFKVLKHAAVKLGPGVTPVTGKNGAGKSTFLDVIKHLLADARQHSTEVIRRGEESCELYGDLGPFTVERRFRKTEKGELQTVVLKAKDGTRLQHPQAILDSFYTAYTFHPLAFDRLDAKKKLEEVRRLTGVNTGPLDGKRQDLYEQRTEVNRKATDLAARLRAMPGLPPNLPAEPVDVKALLTEQEAKRKEQQQQQTARSALESLKREVESTTATLERQRRLVDQYEKQLELAKRDLVIHAEAVQLAADAYNAQQEIVAKLVEPEFSQLGEKISAAQTTNLWIDRRKQREQLDTEVQAFAQKSIELTKAIDLVDQEKAQLIAAAKMPVPGLSFGENGLLLNGFPLEQASSAERMRLSVAMGFALNPRLKIMAIHDGSLLDDDSMRLLEQLCAEHGGQLLVERVGTESDVGILIEDGEVVPVRAVKGGQQDLGIVVEGRQP
jgi:energy-coupling factor transporter ATP-binding protein EcfA2